MAAKTSEAAKTSVSSEACEDMRVEKRQRRGGGDGDNERQPSDEAVVTVTGERHP